MRELTIVGGYVAGCDYHCMGGVAEGSGVARGTEARYEATFLVPAVLRWPRPKKRAGLMRRESGVFEEEFGRY